MKKTILLVIIGLFSVSSAAISGTCNGEFGWLGKGTAFNLDQGNFVFTGEFSGTLFNTDTNDPTHKMTVQCPGLWHVEGTEGAVNGACIMKDAEGDKMFITFNGKGAFPKVKGPFQITSGTGKFAGASGGGTFLGHTVAFDDAMNGMGYSTWTNCTY